MSKNILGEDLNSVTAVEDNLIIDDFDDALCEYHNGKLLKGLYEYGFERPSQIQAQSIKPIADGRDLIAQAQSGSGKTGAFVIGVFLKINLEINYPQAVILANTRELAIQIHEVATNIGKYIGAKITLCTGGNIEGNDINSNLKTALSSHILVCTPGRLISLIDKKLTLLNNLKILVFDEADQLLANDFLSQIQNILKHLPKNTQICLFSATACSNNIKNTKGHFLNNPVELYIQKEQIKVDLIKNYVVEAMCEDNKYQILIDLYKNINICQAVIFINTSNRANKLAERLRHDGHSVGLIHGSLPDIDRRHILTKFRKTETRILVATDVIARGIDVQQVGLVINYDIPNGEGYAEQYIHRVGRSGRYGKLGVSINIITQNPYELERLHTIAKTYNVQFFDLPELDFVNHYLTGVNGYNYCETT